MLSKASLLLESLVCLSFRSILAPPFPFVYMEIFLDPWSFRADSPVSGSHYY